MAILKGATSGLLPLTVKTLDRETRKQGLSDHGDFYATEELENQG